MVQILKFILELETNNVTNYIQNMRNTWCWGSAIEIEVACNIWKLCIIVKNFRDRKGEENEFIPVINNKDNIYKRIQLEWNGGHYEAVRN